MSHVGGLYNALVQTFGPVLQAACFLFLLLLAIWCIGSAAFWSERRLIRIPNPVLWTLPFPILAAGLLYGGLRFSGWLLYPTDGWDPGGSWNYTHQNGGACVLFVCGCLLAGAVVAVYREKIARKKERGVSLS